MSKPKPETVRTTVTLDKTVKQMIEKRAAEERRDFSAQANILLYKGLNADAADRKK